MHVSGPHKSPSFANLPEGEQTSFDCPTTEIINVLQPARRATETACWVQNPGFGVR